MPRHVPTFLLALVVAAWILERNGPVPRSVEWQLLSTATECRHVGRTAEDVIWLGYAPGDSSKYEHVEFTRRMGRATMTVTVWGILDDATSARRGVYHLEDGDTGLRVMDCSYENACWRTPFGLGGGGCP
jgi:hypothetical protein